MADGDDANLFYSGSIETADRANKAFYDRYGSFPAAPLEYRFCEDSRIWRQLVLQEIGDWDHTQLPEGGRIWMPGCGAYHAIEMATWFPDHEILATDISTGALEFSAAVAKRLGISNVEFKPESIFDASYEASFDLVICRGVIHHTADPQGALAKLARSLKPDGILDLLVWNHSFRGWRLALPFQNAVRILGGSSPDAPRFESELSLAHKLVQELDRRSAFLTELAQQFHTLGVTTNPGSLPVELLLEPVAHTYTVASLDEMCNACDLSMIVPAAFSKEWGSLSWNLDFVDSELRARYEVLPAKSRWQLANLLLAEQPRGLRFYCQRTDNARPIKDDKQLCDEFLRLPFRKIDTVVKVYERTPDAPDPRDWKPRDRFDPATLKEPRTERFPPTPDDPLIIRVLEALDEGRPIGETLSRLKLADSFVQLDILRRKLTSPSSPYLLAR